MIDFHVHSTASDGEYSPEVLVQMAKDKWLVWFSISDHDTVSWSILALKKWAEIGVRVISAVEISATFQGKALHILGYDFSPEDTKLESWLEAINNYRKERARKIATNINTELIAEKRKPIDIETILSLGIERPITRVDLAQYLLSNGYVSTLQEAFEKWLIKYDIPNKEFSVEQAVDLIHSAWWVAVLAHPGSEGISLRSITTDPNKQLDIIRYFQSKWLDGLEVYRFNQSKETEDFYLHIANSLGLIATGWSDFHGPKFIWMAPWIWNNDAPDNVVDRILEIGRKRK